VFHVWLAGWLAGGAHLLPAFTRTRCLVEEFRAGLHISVVNFEKELWKPLAWPLRVGATSPSFSALTCPLACPFALTAGLS